MTHKQHPKQALIKGAIWTLGTRWSIKLIGFLNTVIMARLLMPADYGVVAMATLTVDLIRAFMDVGATTALLRKSTVSNDEIDSAWTLRLLQSLVAGTLLLIGASMASSYFDEPRVQPILWVLAVGLVLEGASNIGMTLAQKAFQFALDYKVSVVSKVVSVVTTIALGLLLQDYRALVGGIAAGSMSAFILSYALHPYRPRWNTRKIAEIWGVTKWLMLSNMGSFLVGRSDEFIAARVGTTGEYGAYHVGGDLGRLAVSEVGPAMVRAFLPVLATIKDDVHRTNAAVLKTLAAANAVTLPMGFGVAAVAAPLTELVLGAAWHSAIPFVALYAVVASIRFLTSPLNALLILFGHTRSQSSVIWLELLFFTLGVLLLLPTFHLVGLVVARLLATVACMMVIVGFAQRHCQLSATKVAGVLWRPVLGSMCMYLLIVSILPSLSGPPWVRVLAGVCFGATFYGAWSLVSWRFAGRPEGLESTVFDALRARSRRA